MQHFWHFHKQLAIYKLHYLGNSRSLQAPFNVSQTAVYSVVPPTCAGSWLNAVPDLEKTFAFELAHLCDLKWLTTKTLNHVYGKISHHTARAAGSRSICSGPCSLAHRSRVSPSLSPLPRIGLVCQDRTLWSVFRLLKTLLPSLA